MNPDDLRDRLQRASQPPHPLTAPVVELRRRGRLRRSRQLGAAFTAALVLLGGGFGSAAAAQQAMPGDTLYGMKRSIENVSTTSASGMTPAAGVTSSTR